MQAIPLAMETTILKQSAQKRNASNPTNPMMIQIKFD